MLKPLILMVILIILNAIFASAEIAVISISSSKLKKMASEGDKRAGKLLTLTDQPARFLATIQVAITLAGLLQSAFAAENFATPLVAFLIDLGVHIPENILRAVSIVVITLILAYFNLVFGELIPKRVAMKKSEKLALSMAGMLYAVAKIFAPVVWLLTISTNGILRLFGMNPDENEEIVTEEEIRMMLVEGNEQGTIEEEENEIIQNVFEFNDTTVEEIYTHRKETIVLSIRDDEKEWADIIKGNRHTFYPVSGKNMDDITGILDTRDYFRLSDKCRGNIMKKAVKKPFFVYEGMKANDLFQKMKERHEYFAVVIDEYGGFSGIITLHDLLEALIGDIGEEESDEPADIIELSENTWQIKGYADLGEVAEELEFSLPEDLEDEYDTFSGYVCGVIGRIPADGEVFSCETDDLMIDVKAVKGHIIEKAIVKRKVLEETEVE